MSKNKERIKRRRALQKEIEELKTKEIEIESECLENKINLKKSLHIRNLNIFKNTINLFTPLILSAGVTISGFAIFNGGFPFITDQEKKYKRYDVDYNSYGYTTMDERYEDYNIFGNKLPKSHLTIYTPWEEIDGDYVRAKRSYNLDEENLLNIYDAIKKQDIDYISNYLTNYSEEIQKSNIKLYSEEDNEMKVDASIHTFDKSNFIEIDETVSKNIIITLLEFCIILGVGILTIEKNIKSYKTSNQNFNNVYLVKKDSYNFSVEQLEEIRKRIKVLRKKVNNDEK